MSYCSADFTRHYWFGVVVGLLNSEYPQQNRANENKHGAYRQHIELQGKVHGVSLVNGKKLAHNPKARWYRAPAAKLKKKLIREDGKEAYRYARGGGSPPLEQVTA